MDNPELIDLANRMFENNPSGAAEQVGSRLAVALRVQTMTLSVAMAELRQISKEAGPCCWMRDPCPHERARAILAAAANGDDDTPRQLTHRENCPKLDGEDEPCICGAEGPS